MKSKTITMASSSRSPRPTLYRDGDSQILTVPIWKDNKTLTFLSVFMAFLLVTWIHGFLQPILSEWRGAQSTLSHGQKVSGWIWALVLLGLTYYALYQWKGRLVLIAGPDRLFWIRDMVLFRIRREYLGMYIRNLRWSMPEKLPMPFRMQAVQVTNGSIQDGHSGAQWHPASCPLW